MKRVHKPWSMKRVLSLFDPIIAEWFLSRYNSLTEPQAYAIPLIHRGENVLVSSPTGSGKTLTAFITIINELFLLAKKGQLEDNVYCVYVSPLKALANDIHRNLEIPLQEIKDLASKKGVQIPEIRVSVRSGDTSTSERQKMLRKPPHIFITTPESLSLVLTAPKFREKFRNVRYVIVDEIHEIASNKRGVMLSLNLERLAYLAGDFQRIGLSATQAPIEEIARFLAGYDGDKERDIHIVEVEMRKKLDLKVLTPVENLTIVPYEVATERMYDMLVDIVSKNRTTLIFTNTRSGTEHVAYKLKERGITSLEAHHGSLSKETRLRVEKLLKEGKLKAVISSTSLELGIDIGYIDMVVQIGSPKSVAKGLQRIGRSGHAYGAVARGRFLVFDNDDLIECATLVKCAYDGKIDRIRIPKNSLDVLSQIIVGMALEKRWDVDEAYSMIKNSYCYHTLPKEKFIHVLRYLGGHTLGDTVYSKIWYDEEEGKFGKKRSSRMIYFMNTGTIPDEADYLVVDTEGHRLGDLSEKFVERLQKGDVFVLGARTYEVVRIRAGKVVVKDAPGKRPTVPSWVGEMLPRSFDLSIEVGKFREFVENSIREIGEEKTVKRLVDEYYLDLASARSIVSYIKEGMAHIVPTHRRVVIEGYIDARSKYNIIFHFPFGRRVNDALSRAYAYKITERYGTNVGISITDDAFMLTTKKKIPLRDMKDLLHYEELESVLKKAVFNTELFKQRFRHCATRSFMVLRKYKGKDISVARQQLRSDRILKILSDIPNFPVIEETYNEIFNIVMDVPHAIEVLRDIEEGKIRMDFIDYSNVPSAFARGIILAGISDIVLMEDRSALLKELHIKLLEKVIPSEELVAVFDEEQVTEYFSSKIRIKSKEDLLKFIELSPGADVLRRRGINIYDFAEIGEDELRNIVEEMMKNDEIVSVYTTRLLWTTPSNYPVFSTLYAKICENIIEFDGLKTADEIARESKLKLSEAKEILRCMEKAYLVGRKILEGKTYWYRREPVSINRDYAIEILLKNLLYFRGPLTFEEIVYSLHLPEHDIQRVLKYMVKEEIVVKGKFLVGYGEQYMLREDYEVLKKKTGMEKSKITAHRFNKIVRRMDLDEYFSKFLVAFSEDSLRVRGCHNKFMELIETGDVYYGRFMRGRLCYTTRKNLPLLISVYRKESLTEKDRRVLSLIGMLGEQATLPKIQTSSNIYPHEVKKIIEKLESNLYISRIPHSNSKNPVYRVIKSEPEGTVEEFLKTVVKNYGPLTEPELRHLTNLNVSGYLHLFKKLYSEGCVYYHLDEKIFSEDKRCVILPVGDPFIYPVLHDIYDKFDEIYSHVLVCDGEVLASGNIKRFEDYIEITEVNGDSKRFYETAAKSELVITDNPVNAAGFKKIGEWWIGGKVSDKYFSQKEIVSYILWKNRCVPGRKLRSVLDVARYLMGVHTDYESFRAFKPLSIEKYFLSELLYEGPDLKGLKIYAPRETFGLFMALKNFKLDDDMAVILRIFEKYKKMSVKEIMEESPLGIERTNRALTALYDANRIVRCPRGYILVEKRYSREYAAEKFIETLLEIFGMVSPEMIHTLSNGTISAYEAKTILDTFPLEKGMFLKDGKIYRMLREDLEDMEYIDSHIGVLILHPHDILNEYLSFIYPQSFSGGFLVVKNGEIIGTVKAKLKKRVFTITKASTEEAEELFKKYFRIL